MPIKWCTKEIQVQEWQKLERHDNNGFLNPQKSQKPYSSGKQWFGSSLKMFPQEM